MGGNESKQQDLFDVSIEIKMAAKQIDKEAKRTENKVNAAKAKVAEV